MIKHLPLIAMINSLIHSGWTASSAMPAAPPAQHHKSCFSKVFIDTTMVGQCKHSRRIRGDDSGGGTQWSGDHLRYITRTQYDLWTSYCEGKIPLTKQENQNTYHLFNILLWEEIWLSIKFLLLLLVFTVLLHSFSSTYWINILCKLGLGNHIPDMIAQPGLSMTRDDGS